MRIRSTSAIGLLVVLLNAGVGAAQQVSPVAGGLEALFAGDTEKASALLKAHIYSADDPDPWALYGLGLLHRDGRGVSQDRVMACAYFAIAAAQFARQNSGGSIYGQMA